MNVLSDRCVNYDIMINDLLGRVLKIIPGDVKTIKKNVKKFFRRGDVHIGEASLGTALYAAVYGSISMRDEDKDSYAKSEGHFRYIPSDRSQLYHAIEYAFPGKKRFIDVGSGIGDKVMLAWASKQFDECAGIEYTKETHDIAKSLVDWPGINLINGDAKKFDFGGYDAIYTYMPISKPSSLIELYHRVLTTMPVGGILYEVYDSGLNVIFDLLGRQYKYTWSFYVWYIERREDGYYVCSAKTKQHKYSEFGPYKLSSVQQAIKENKGKYGDWE